MNAQENAPDSFVTIPQVDLVFDRKSIYLSGQSFIRCTFKSCTLIVKDFALLGMFEDCTLENCVWHLNFTVSDSLAWQEFLKGVAPAITATLPPSENVHGS